MFNENIFLINESCEEYLPKLIEQGITVDLIIFDPPYFSTNIQILGDNNWKSIEIYFNWFKKTLSYLDQLLSNRGTIYIFHNDLSIMVDVLYYMKHELNYVLRNNIKFDKRYQDNFSMVLKSYGNNRNYSSTFSEDIFYLTKQTDYPKSPFSHILNDALTRHKRKDIAALIPSRTGKITNWIQNHLTGRAIPTREQWAIITNYIKIPDNYDELVEIYAESRYCFNQEEVSFKNKSITEQKNILMEYSEILTYEPESIDDIEDFKFNKPYRLIEQLVKISSNPGDIVLDCTMGSGTTGLVCRNTNRKFIGIENNNNTFKIAKNRINI